MNLSVCLFPPSLPTINRHSADPIKKMKDILDKLEDGLWNDKEGVLLSAMGEIVSLREMVIVSDQKFVALSSAVSELRLSISDYFEATLLHDVELLRRKAARLNINGNEVMADINFSLTEIIRATDSDAPLESAMRMISGRMKAAAELVDAIIPDRQPW